MQRLKTRPQFQAVMAGELVSKSAHFALHRLKLNALDATTIRNTCLPPGSWIGAMTPKRWAKRAVTRNSIKRQIYTVCISANSACDDTAFLVRLKREFSRQEFVSASSRALSQAVRAELKTLVQGHMVSTHSHEKVLAEP